MATSELVYVREWLSKQIAVELTSDVDVHNFVGGSEIDTHLIQWITSTTYTTHSINSARVGNLARRIYSDVGTNCGHSIETVIPKLTEYLSTRRHVTNYRGKWYSSFLASMPRISWVSDDSSYGPMITSIISSVPCPNTLSIYFAKGSIYNEIAAGTTLNNIAGQMSCAEYRRIIDLAYTTTSEPAKIEPVVETKNVAASSSIQSCDCAKNIRAPEFVLDVLRARRTEQADTWYRAKSDVQEWHMRAQETPEIAKAEHDRASKRLELERSRLQVLDDIIKSLS